MRKEDLTRVWCELY